MQSHISRFSFLYFATERLRERRRNGCRRSRPTDRPTDLTSPGPATAAPNAPLRHFRRRGSSPPSISVVLVTANSRLSRTSDHCSARRRRGSWSPFALSFPIRCTAVPVLFSLPAQPRSSIPAGWQGGRAAGRAGGRPSTLPCVRPSIRLSFSLFVHPIAPSSSFILRSFRPSVCLLSRAHFIYYCTNENRRGGHPRGVPRGAPPWPPAPASPAR